MKQNGLDEMQEKNLLKLEEVGFWLLFWSLAAAIVIQALLKPDMEQIAGEIVCLVVASIYLVYTCMKNGICSKKGTAPTRKGNIWVSVIPGAFLLCFLLARCLLVLHRMPTAAEWTFIALLPIAASVVTFAILEILRVAFERKRKQLDDAPEME